MDLFFSFFYFTVISLDYLKAPEVMRKNKMEK